MPCKLIEKGFSLIELLVTIAIVGIIAAISVAQFEAYRLNAQVAAAGKELLDLRVAFYAYLADHQELPADTGRGVIPAGMSELIPASLFSEPTPVGGQYNWDGPPNHTPPGISIEGPTIPVAYLSKLDKFLDDGNLFSGQFQITNDGHYKLTIEP